MPDTEYQADLHKTIQDVLNGLKDGGVLTKWVVVAEVMYEDEKKLQTFRADHLVCPIWDVRGMLREVAEDPNAFEGEEDD